MSHLQSMLAIPRWPAASSKLRTARAFCVMQLTQPKEHESGKHDFKVSMTTNKTLSLNEML